MSESGPRSPNGGNLDDYLEQIMRNMEKSGQLDDESIDAVERAAKPVDGEEESKRRLLQKLNSSQVDLANAQTLGQYVRLGRGQTSLSELGKRLHLSPMFLRELESDQVNWEGLVSGLVPRRLAQLIVALELDVDHFVNLMFHSPRASGDVSFSRTASDLSMQGRARIQEEAQAAPSEQLSPGHKLVTDYIKRLHSEVRQLKKGDDPSAT